MPEAIVAGHICLDIIPELRGSVSFEPGRLIEAGPATLSTGGAVSNTGLALERLGVSTTLMGKVSDDLFGRATRELLGEHGREMIIAPGEPSSYTVVIDLKGQDRMFLHAPGCNDTFVASDVPDEVLAQAKLLHFGYPPLMARMFADHGEELVRLLRRAKDAGLVTSLDMSLPDSSTESGRADWPRILERALPYCDLFLPSVDEVLYMLDRQTFNLLRGALMSLIPSRVFSTIADRALDMGAGLVGVKAGSRGIMVKSQPGFAPLGLDGWSGVELWSPCFSVEVVGSTGAGDATIAGLLMGLLRGMSPSESATAAVAAGACCCEALDATSGVRPWPEMLARIEAGWERRSPDLGPEWQPDPLGSYWPSD